MKSLSRIITVAKGEQPADLLIRNAQVFNSVIGDFFLRNVLVVDGYIAALLRDEECTTHTARETVDASGQWLIPGFIDAHVHIESSMLTPFEFSKMCAVNGVSTLVADPHEIANVLGTKGIEFMLQNSEHALARFFFMLPSCVPASALDEAAYTLEANDLRSLLRHPRVLGLGEMMNYPGVLGCAPDVMEKLEMIDAWNREQHGMFKGLAVDGHAPFVEGSALQAYAAAGIRSDHEASTVEEATERLAAGIALMMREGSGAKNLLDLVPAVTPHTEHLCMLCTDDRHVDDLKDEGSINFLVRMLVEDGRLSLASILRMASYNTARHFGLRETGSIAPGLLADFALYPDLKTWQPSSVWLQGKNVARDGKALAADANSAPVDASLRNTVVLASSITEESLAIADKGTPVRVIETIPGQLLTRELQVVLPTHKNVLVADPDLAIAKLAVFERHRNTGRVGLGFVKGMGLPKGAVASTVAHDSHNLVVMGMNDADMFLAVKTLEQQGGGFVVCSEGKVEALVSLPLAGLFAERPLEAMYAEQKNLDQALQRLGVAVNNQLFITLAFLSLAVIPSLKLTDGGLVNGDVFDFTSLYVE